MKNVLLFLIFYSSLMMTYSQENVLRFQLDPVEKVNNLYSTIEVKVINSHKSKITWSYKQTIRIRLGQSFSFKINGKDLQIYCHFALYEKDEKEDIETEDSILNEDNKDNDKKDNNNRNKNNDEEEFPYYLASNIEVEYYFEDEKQTVNDLRVTPMELGQEVEIYPLGRDGDDIIAIIIEFNEK